LQTKCQTQGFGVEYKAWPLSSSSAVLPSLTTTTSCRDPTESSTISTKPSFIEHFVLLHTQTTVNMQFTTLIISALAATAFAYPTTDKPGNGGGGNGDGGNGGGGNGFVACANNGLLYSSALCCATDVLGLADLDCAPPPKVPTSSSDFQAVCTAIGQRPRCCLAPLLGQALVCQTPIGAN
jgi:hypothetical protein